MTSTSSSLSCRLFCWQMLFTIGSLKLLTPTIFIQEVLNMTEEHDHRVHPSFNSGRPTNITSQVRLLNLDSFSETDMDYRVDLVLTMHWKDRRLRFHKLIDLSRIEMHSQMMKLVWTPDIYFVNEKMGDSHHLKSVIRRLFLRHDGWISYSEKLSMRLNCDMSLVWYPHDIQHCHIRLASFSHTTNQVQFLWNEINPVELFCSKTLPQYEIRDPIAGNCNETSITGDQFTCLQINLELVRQAGFYLLQIYIPSLMIVAVSWVSFWLSIDATPARVSLGVLTLLTMTTQSSGARAPLPRVSYVTALDVWMATCLSFTFFALIEYAVVNILMRWRFIKQNIPKSTPRADDPDWKKQLFVYGRVPSLKTRKSCSERDNPSISKPEGRREEKVSGRQTAHLVDRYARVLFPGIFLIFNIAFWSTVLFH